MKPWFHLESSNPPFWVDLESMEKYPFQLPNPHGKNSGKTIRGADPSSTRSWIFTADLVATSPARPPSHVTDWKFVELTASSCGTKAASDVQRGDRSRRAMKLKVTKIPTSLRRAAWTRPAKGQDGVVQFGAGSWATDLREHKTFRKNIVWSIRRKWGVNWPEMKAVFQ